MSWCMIIIKGVGCVVGLHTSRTLTFPHFIYTAASLSLQAMQKSDFTQIT